MACLGEIKGDAEMSIDINLKQTKELVDVFGEDEDVILSLTLGDDKFHSGPGLYVCDEYPEHGFIFLGRNENQE